MRDSGHKVCHGEVGIQLKGFFGQLTRVRHILPSLPALNLARPKKVIIGREAPCAASPDSSSFALGQLYIQFRYDSARDLILDLEQIL